VHAARERGGAQLQLRDEVGGGRERQKGGWRALARGSAVRHHAAAAAARGAAGGLVQGDARETVAEGLRPAVHAKHHRQCVAAEPEESGGRGHHQQVRRGVHARDGVVKPQQVHGDTLGDRPDYEVIRGERRGRPAAVLIV
jgi:hypothetical protein